MSRRNRAVVLAATFLGGVILGGVTIGFFSMRNHERLMLDWAVTNTFEETMTLREIQSGGADRTEERIYAALPGFASHLAGHRSRGDVAEALWAIRLAYTASGREIPTEIEPLVRDLPPGAAPRCRVRQDALGAGGGSAFYASLQRTPVE